MARSDSSEIARRIEALYGAPLGDLSAWAQDQPPGLLSALLSMHTRLAGAESTIAGSRERLTELLAHGRSLGSADVAQVLAWSRRLADAVALREGLSPSLTSVLGSLTRVQEASTPPPALPAPAPPLAANATPPAR
ncbi:hypothetical protein [Streptomyces sp. GZWMJZ-114]|uniref:hypothetical protein n=1 Tax=Streptomyces sp. GZWMJZ-114 TaxID=2494734 RepID=UPI001010B44E|nr:hypothetical protein [Streptomyces sp. GZWMJZ-114]